MKRIKVLFYLFFSIQIVFANENLENLASTIATPFYNVYNKNVIELIEQYKNQNKNIEAIKIYDILLGQTSLVFYKQNGKFIHEIDKDFPSSVILPNRLSSTKIIKNGKTIGTLTLYYNAKQGNEILSREENEYLNSKKIINMCVDPNWLPFEKIEDGKHIGLAADIIKIISDNFNINTKLVITKSWQESLDFVKSKKCDILSLVAKTEKKEKYMSFGPPYINTPIVIATRTRVPFIDNVEQIINEKLGIVRGYSLYEKFKTKYPKINLVEVDSIDDGLEKVENGEIFGYIDNSLVLNYEIQRQHIGTLAISGKFENNHSLSIATRKDEPILYSIFRKAINSLGEEKRNELYKKWITLKTEKIKITDYSLVYKVAIFSIFLLILFGYWNRKISKANKELEHAKKEIEKLAITDKLTGLNNRAKLDDILINEIERTARFNHDMIFCIFDIDYFKVVNDKYGHQMGDKVLIEFAKITQQNVRKTDYVGRWGGEEFVIICPETNKEGGLKLIKNLRKIISSRNFFDIGSITASFGVTQFHKGDNVDSIMKRADDALYKAKEAGRNSTIFVP